MDSHQIKLLLWFVTNATLFILLCYFVTKSYKIFKQERKEKNNNSTDNDKYKAA